MQIFSSKSGTGYNCVVDFMENLYVCPGEVRGGDKSVIYQSSISHDIFNRFS